MAVNSLLFIFFKDLNKYGDDKSTVSIHISASLFPVFCLNARDKFAAKLKYGDHQSSSSWKWFCVTLLATFTSAYALGFINSRQGSLF